VSKRNFRRLAVVAGAAVAVGSMAPAMAASVSGGSDGSATVDISGVTAPTLPTVLPAGFVDGLTGTALTTAQAAPGMALTDVNNLMADAFGIGGDLLASGLPAASLNAGANASSGGSAGGSASGSVTIPLDAVGTATDGSGVLADDALGAAAPVVGTALGMADTAVGLAQSAPGIALETAGGLLSGGLGILDGSSASGNVNVLASLMGSI
jgi:hypothetical protein